MVGRWVPIRDPRTNREFKNYEDLVQSSTEEFRDKHLILNDRNRRKLLDLCYEELGRENETFFHVSSHHKFYKALKNACQGMAQYRLQSILKYGFFETFHFDVDTNTLIVSARGRIFVHIEKSNDDDFDLWIRIEEKTSCAEMSDRLSCNSKGKIDHLR